MKKHLVALLSVVGLAGSSAPAQGQVLKGSAPASTKHESTIKDGKARQEKTSADKNAQHKAGKVSAEKTAASANVTEKGGKTDAAIKLQKSQSEIKAGKAAQQK